MQREGIEQAIAQGLLADTLDPERLGEQIYHGYELAAVQWAFGLLDAAGFRARALYGMYLALLAVASDAALLIARDDDAAADGEPAVSGRSISHIFSRL